jgi:hypothetical protein
MIERVRKFLHGRVATSAGQGMAGAATVHVCVHPCPEHLAMALVFWVMGLYVSLKGGSDA